MQTFIQESTLYPDLIQHLIEQGFSAFGETKFKDGTRPDILFEYQGEKFVVEVKLDDPKIALEAVAQATKYAQKLGTRNFIVLIFPKKLKGQAVLGTDFLNEIVLKTEILVYVSTKWVKNIPKINFIDFVSELKEKFEKKEPTIDFETVVSRINDYVRDFNEAVYRFNQESLTEEIVNKLDLFSAIGDFKDKETAQKQVLNLASFLLFNQILFYYIFQKKTKDKVTELIEIQQVKDIQTYFDQIQEIDYKSIYKINILGHIPNEPYFIGKLNDLIVGVQGLRAEYITHDLAGRFFHELIPHEVRKVLAAFYTHPNAADLLAGLLIENYDQSLIDPACGSGTLLVAAYKRKQWLYEKVYGFANQAQMHKDFIEKEITGLDIMPFAAHISTINLTMQNIEQITNIVRFATRDSLDLAKPFNKSAATRETDFFGIDIESYNETIQGTMFKMYEQKAIKQGALNPEGESAGFKLTLSDIVIMNPPYSDREKMPLAWRDKLNSNETLHAHCGNLVNLWGYFLVLGDLLVKENGLVGSVIPINFARGKATEKIRNFILENHQILYLIKPVGDMAFSEGATFKDILLITQKTKPDATQKSKIIYLKKTIKELSEKQLQNVLAKIKKQDSFESAEIDIFSVDNQTLMDNRKNLMFFLWSKNKKDYETVKEFYANFITKKVVSFPKGLVREGFHSYTAGVIELVFITNPKEEKTRIERAFMVLDSEGSEYLNIHLGKTELRYKVPKKVVQKAIRTITGVRKFEVVDADYFITSQFPDFEQIIQLSKFKDKENFDWEYVRKNYPKKMVHLVSATKFDLYSPNTSFIAFYSDEPMIATDSLKVYPDLSKEKAKIFCLFLNSVVNILQYITNRQQTTAGGYHAITETDLLEFQLIDYEKLTEKDREKLLAVFDKWRSVPFPSIVEQIEQRFVGRVEMDMALLEVLGYKKGEINAILPDLYEVVLRELKQDF